MATIPKQTSFLTFAAMKRTRRAAFLDTMDQVVPWPVLIAVVAPHYVEATTGRPKTDLELLIRATSLAIWFGLSDEQLEDDIHEMPVFRKFLRLECGDARVPDHTVLCRFRNFLDKHNLTREIFDKVNLLLAQQGLMVREGTAVDATIIDAPSGTKNQAKERTPGMASGKKGANYRFGMKLHAGMDMDSGIAHSITFTAANVADVSETENLIHGDEVLVVGDKGYVSAALKEKYAAEGIDYAVCQKGYANEPLFEKTMRRVSNSKISSVRAIAEYPFRVLKWLWNCDRVRFHGLAKNASWFTFAMTLVNIYQVRRELLKTPLTGLSPMAA
jgi:IS5 family transposase